MLSVVLRRAEILIALNLFFQTIKNSLKRVMCQIMFEYKQVSNCKISSDYAHKLPEYQ